MLAMSAKGVVSSSKKGSGAKWTVIGALFLAVIVAVQGGWVGFGWAALKSAVLPGDEGLLEYIPEDSGGVLLIDPHQIDPKALGGENGAVRQWLSRTREDMKKATGVDLFFDVDKLAIAPEVVVVRGRFNAADLDKRLGEMSYKPEEHHGQKCLARAGEDAVCVVDSSLLLYGTSESVAAALDAKETGKSLENKEGVTDRLKAVGYNHPVLMTISFGEAKPSVRDILMGSTGSRAVTVGVSTTAGLDVTASIEAYSAASAEELRKLLEEKRTSATALRPVLGSASDALVDALQKAEIKADKSHVTAHAHLSPEQLDKVMKAAGSSAPFGEMYKNLRLFQLLLPSN